MQSSNQIAAGGQQPSCERKPTSYLNDKTLRQLVENSDTESLGEGPHQIVYFDLETSGFGRHSEICQIAAIYNDKTFSEYILPTNGISGPASMVNGLVLFENVLYKNGVPLKTITLTDCLQKFLNFIEEAGKSVILAGHNILTFDCRFLLRDVHNSNLNEKLFSNVLGLLDTLPMLKALLPERKTFRLSSLAEDYLTEEDCQGLHDALCDVKALQKIIQKLNLSDETICKWSRTLKGHVNKKITENDKSNNISSLQPLIGPISSVILNKLANCGITFSMLQEIYMTKGEEGITTLLSEPDINGKPKITKNKKIISRLITVLDSRNE